MNMSPHVLKALVVFVFKMYMFAFLRMEILTPLLVVMN